MEPIAEPNEEGKEEVSVLMVRVKQREFAQFMGRFDLVTGEKVFTHGSGRGKFGQQCFFEASEIHGTRVIPDRTKLIGVINFEPGYRATGYFINSLAQPTL